MPAKFCRGPRYTFGRQQDALVYVRKCGRPDLFITVTTNPKWLKILECSIPGQQPHDRPDLLVRVCCLKIQNLFKILKDGCFGCLEAPVLNVKSVVYRMNLFFFNCHMMPNSISVTIFYHFICLHFPKTPALSL